MIYILLVAIVLLILGTQTFHNQEVKALHVRISEAEHDAYLKFTHIWRELDKNNDFVIVSPIEEKSARADTAENPEHTISTGDSPAANTLLVSSKL